MISLLTLCNTTNKVKVLFSNLIKNNNFSQVELILLDVSEENNEKIKDAIKKYTNVIYINAKGKSKSEAYNIGIEICKGDYISFIEDGVYYSKNTITSIKKYIKRTNKKLVCIKSHFIQEDTKKDYSICPDIKDVDLISMPHMLNLAFDSYFFNSKLLEDKRFDTSLDFEDAKFKMLLELLSECSSYHLIKNKKIYYEIPKEDDTSKNFMQYDKTWYNESIVNFVIPFLNKMKEKNSEIPLYIQNAMLYYIFAKYNCNLNDRNKMVLSSVEAKDFFNNTAEALKYIDTNLIIQADKQALYKIPRWLSNQFVLEKNKKLEIDTSIEIENNEIKLCDKQKKEINYTISEVKDETANIYAINYNKNVLEIDFSISIQDFIEESDITAFIKYGNKCIEAKKTNCYPLLKVFGLTVAKKIPFHVSINLEDKNEKIEFYFKYKNEAMLLNLKYEKVQSHLSNSKFSYWKFNKKYYLCNKKQHLKVQRKYIFSGIFKELQFCIAKILTTKRPIFTLKYLGLRFIYWLVKPFYKNKQIWITFDKLYKAGDNGEYIYKYIKENHPEIKIYYVIKKESLDYERLKNEKNSNILVYETVKHKLMSLLSTAILDTHANAISYCSFDTEQARNLIKDLFNAEIICIQHGLTIQKIAQYQNRLFDNIRLYCCASKYEIENLLKPIYDYEPSQLKLTGLARYDGLKSNDKRQILITPTWRRNIVNSNVAHIKKTHNNFFKNSKYYQIYSTLINDKKLIETAKKNNYKIIYLLHPAISAQKDDYEKNEYVEIIAATDNMNYERILTEASLMVTDYSGVQFDFAYMRKPVVYYHPDELPPHYDAGGLDYEKNGFGPICKNNEQIVNTLCEYMEKNCKTKEVYIKRANDFFAYDDYNNCERIYNAIINYMKERN